jgi:hypothetical protein
VQLSGGFCEAKRLRHGDEVAQMTKFHRAKTSRVNRLDALTQKKNFDYERRLAHTQTAILKKYYVLPTRYWPDHDRRRIDLHAGRCLECWTLIYEPKRFRCLERKPS